MVEDICRERTQGTHRVSRKDAESQSTKVRQYGVRKKRVRQYGVYGGI
jgi:hypothetical protein